MLAPTRRSPASGPDEGNPLEAEQGYLGPSLPAVEIAAAAVQDRARAIGLSLVYPEDDPNMEREFQDLRRLAGSKVAIVVGGRARPAIAQPSISLARCSSLI